MKTINMRAVDAAAEGLITQARLISLIKEHGLIPGRNYPIPVEVRE